MVASNFKASLALVLQSEGGNDDDPADHGGRTSRGITQREYDAWRAENKKPLMDVWSASQADINAIYREEYWDPFCDGLPKGLDYLYFDMAVNAGPNRAAILLQRALKVTDDGGLGRSLGRPLPRPIRRSSSRISRLRKKPSIEVCTSPSS
jgi:lysozyme family protein